MVVTTAKRPKPRTHMTADDLAHEGALALVEEQFRDLDVVWAKVAPFPWWPAVVFHSWDAVRDVGLPTEEKKLPILEPRREPVLDASGTETSAFRVVRYCLVMFVDQFNYAVVETSPKFIVSYVAYYSKHREAVVNCKPGSKNAKYKKRFNEALAKADGLLHMVGDKHTIVVIFTNSSIACSMMTGRGAHARRFGAVGEAQGREGGQEAADRLGVPAAAAFSAGGRIV
jgi:hypothetical protein